MTGRKSLKEVRRELESALGNPVEGTGEVAAALRRFLAKAKPEPEGTMPKAVAPREKGDPRIPATKRS